MGFKEELASKAEKLNVDEKQTEPETTRNFGTKTEQETSVRGQMENGLSIRLLMPAEIECRIGHVIK